MASDVELAQIEILDIFADLEQKLGKTMMSFTEVGTLLHKNPTVISQYAKAGLVTPIQQGPRKVISLEDVYFLKACIYAIEHYGSTYTCCKLIKGLLRNIGIPPAEALNYIKSIEKQNNITKEEVAKYANSYKSRGIFQKQTNQK